DVSNVTGFIRATGMSGRLTLSSLEGRVLAEHITGDLYARTLSGSIAIREATGIVEAQAVSGGIELFNVRARSITAGTYQGGISLKGELADRALIQLSTRGGPIAMPEGGGCANLTPGNRSITLRTDSAGVWSANYFTRGDSSMAVTMGIMR